MLAQLSSELLNDPLLAKEYVALAGQDVASAVLSLGQAFLSNPLPNPLVPKLLPVSQNALPGLAKVSSIPNYVDKKSSSLPLLPTITDSTLAQLPFIHPGSLDAASVSPDASYERLELLGDAYIEVIATRLIHSRFPHLAVGRLCQIRESLVKNETLAEFSLAYNFDERAIVPHTIKEAGRQRQKVWTKVLGDVFEAYVAAVVLSDSENGFNTAENWLVALWMPKLPEQNQAIQDNPDAKQELSRKIMHRGTRIEYKDEGQAPVKKDGKNWYSMGVHFTGYGWEAQHLGSGKGLGKSEAGMRAAMSALQNPLTAQIASVKRDRMAELAAKVEQKEETSEHEPDEPT